MVVLFSVIWNILHAMSDGLYDNGKKTLSKVLRFVLLASVIIPALAELTGHNYFKLIDKDFISIVISFGLVRYFLFDAVYNLTRGLNIFYIGNTGLLDKILQKFMRLTGGVGFVIIIATKMIAGFIGIIYLATI
jgi:hypothetical protein